jgi:hypothetical protein
MTNLKASQLDSAAALTGTGEGWAGFQDGEDVQFTPDLLLNYMTGELGLEAFGEAFLGTADAAAGRAALGMGNMRLVRLLSGGALSVTGTTAETHIAAADTLVPGGLLGSYGSLLVQMLWGFTNNGNAKSPIMRFGGSTFWAPTGSSHANLGSIRPVTLEVNNLTATSQVAMASNSSAVSSTSALITTSIDTTVDQTVSFHAQPANAGDTITLGYFRVLALVPYL